MSVNPPVPNWHSKVDNKKITHKAHNFIHGSHKTFFELSSSDVISYNIDGYK